MQRTCDLEVIEIKQWEEYFDIEYEYMTMNFYIDNMKRGKVRSFYMVVVGETKEGGRIAWLVITPRNGIENDDDETELGPD